MQFKVITVGIKKWRRTRNTKEKTIVQEICLPINLIHGDGEHKGFGLEERKIGREI